MMMKLSRLVPITACLLSLTLWLVSCSNQPAFQIFILEEGFGQLSLGYGAEKSWAILKGVDLDGSAFVITDTDIEVYNWSTHTINLTPIASSRFKDTFGGEGSSIYLDHRAFVVTLNGERLYGGLFLQISSAMAIDYPVIYPETYQLDKVLLSIRPTHRFGEIDPSRVHEIEFEAIYEHFNAQGKLAQ